MHENTKKQQKNLSVLSSSDEDEDAKDINVVHHVNRGDGEMPENALSSNEEDVLFLKIVFLYFFSIV